MPIEVAVGTQWGDEGKGRIVDLLAARADLVARFNGGDNAGHTVTVGSKTFKLHLIPSGIIHAHTTCILGSGMVVNPLSFLDELAMLKEAGIQVSSARLFISQSAHLITPAHRLLDQAQDEARGAGRLGTTGRGIGPAYVDKAARRGLRAGDILDEAAFRGKVQAHITETAWLLRDLYHQEPVDVEALTLAYVEKALLLAPYIRDTGAIVRRALVEGKRLLAEAAQGTLLDLDHGTYPFVTSSSTSAQGIFAGLGIGLQPVARVIGITKAFQTRVGAGPFTTELSGDLAVRLRGTGENPWDEYGTTTGRPRRVGWLDGVLLKYAVDLNGVSELAVTKLDILSGLPTLRICTAYTTAAGPCQEFDISRMDECAPQYEELPGWQADVRGVRRWQDLPAEACRYIRKIEDLAGVPVRLVSVGPERDQVIRLE